MPFTGHDPPLNPLLDLFKRTKDEVEPFEVVITGGEPFIRSDVMTILEAASTIFGQIGVTTNGTRLSSLSQADLAQLREISGKRGRLQVSIDSIRPSVNDAIRGGTASLLNGLDTLERSGVPFCAGIVVTRMNYASLPTTLEFLLRSYQSLRGIAFMNLMPSEVLGSSWPRLAVGPNEYKSACDTALALAEETRRPDVAFYTDKQNDHVNSVLDEQGIPYCLAGLTKLEVLPNGDVTPCAMIRSIKVGNVYRESWCAIWERSIERLNKLSGEGVVGAQCAHFNQRNLVQLGTAISGSVS